MNEENENEIVVEAEMADYEMVCDPFGQPLESMIIVPHVIPGPGPNPDLAVPDVEPVEVVPVRPDSPVPEVTPFDLTPEETLDILRRHELRASELESIRIILELCNPENIDAFFKVTPQQLSRLTVQQRALYNNPSNTFKDVMSSGDIIHLSEIFTPAQVDHAFASYRDRYDALYGKLENKVQDWVRYELPELKVNNPKLNTMALAAVLFVINCAFKLKRNHFLRPVQLASISLMMLKPRRRGRLLEVKTGEGKSNIVIGLAIARSLLSKSRFIDIVTSHEELAIRDAESAADVFAVFNMTCGTNITGPGEPLANEYRECYDLHVVYGTPSSFIFDLLGTEYFLQGQRDVNKRPFATVIADEVDSMFMDRAMDVCRLAGYAVGYSDVQLAVAKIWMLMSRVESLFTPDGERYVYSGEQNLSRESLLERLAADVEAFLALWETPAVPADRLEDFRQYQQLTELGRVALNMQNLLCPNPYAAAYLRKHLSKYLESAVSAKFFMHDKIDYRVANQQIIIVDRQTGEDRIGMSWRDGLHQFLQLKHGLEVDKETLETNLMTTKSFFLRYSAEEELATRQRQRELEAQQLREEQDLPLVMQAQAGAVLADDAHLAEEDEVVDAIAGAAFAGAHFMDQGATGDTYIIAPAKAIPETPPPLVPVAADEVDVDEDDAETEEEVIESGIFGLSGTLGRSAQRTFLSELYLVDCIDVPTNKPVLRRTLNSSLLTDAERHMQRVLESCLLRVNRGRPALVIADSIALAEQIHAYWLAAAPPGVDVQAKVFSVEEEEFTRQNARKATLERQGSDTFISDGDGSMIQDATASAAAAAAEDEPARTDANAEEEEGYCLDARQVLIATNLLGRGADIDLTAAAAANGGLHVCVAFIPPNRRVLYQAYGRAGRKGLPGSCQVIAAQTQTRADLAPVTMLPEEFEDAVFRHETRDLERLKERIQLFDAQERAFRRYCALLQQIPEIEDTSEEANNHNNNNQLRRIDMQHPIFRTIEEVWAKFFREYNDDAASLDALFEAEVEQPLLADGEEGRRRLVKGPGYLVRLSNKAEGAEAVALCDEALVTDPRHVPAAMQRLVHMMRSNNNNNNNNNGADGQEQQLAFSKEQLLVACRAAKEVVEAACERALAVEVLCRIAAQDAHVEHVLDSFPADFCVEDLGLNSSNNNNNSFGFQQVHRFASSVLQAGRRLINRNNNNNNNRGADGTEVAAADSDDEDDNNTGANGAQSTVRARPRMPPVRARALPASLRPLITCLQRVHLLEQALLVAADVRDIRVSFDALRQDKIASELREEGLSGFPKASNCAREMKRGAWWSIMMGVHSACVGGFLRNAAALGSGAFYSEVQLVGQGATKTIESLHAMSYPERLAALIGPGQNANDVYANMPLTFGEWFNTRTAMIRIALAAFLRAMSASRRAVWVDTNPVLQQLRERRFRIAMETYEAQMRQRLTAAAAAGPQVEAIEAQTMPVAPAAPCNIARLPVSLTAELLPASRAAQSLVVQLLESEQHRLLCNEGLREGLRVKMEPLRNQLKTSLLRPDTRVLVRLSVLIGGYINMRSDELWERLGAHFGRFVQGRDEVTRRPRLRWTGAIPATGVNLRQQVNLNEVCNFAQVSAMPECKLHVYRLVESADKAALGENALCIALYNLLLKNAAVAGSEVMAGALFDREIAAFLRAIGYEPQAQANAVDDNDGEPVTVAGPGPLVWNTLLSFGPDPRFPAESPFTRLLNGLRDLEKRAYQMQPSPHYWEALKKAVTVLADASYDAVIEALQDEVDLRERRYYNL